MVAPRERVVLNCSLNLIFFFLFYQPFFPKTILPKAALKTQQQKYQLNLIIEVPDLSEEKK